MDGVSKKIQEVFLFIALCHCFKFFPSIKIYSTFLYVCLITDFIVSSNHVYVFTIISLLGFVTYAKDKAFKIIIAYFFFIAVFLELVHIIIPERGFEAKDLGGNILGVVISLIIFLIFKQRKKNYKNEVKDLEKNSKYNMGNEIKRVREKYKLRYLSEEATLLSRQETLRKSIEEKERNLREHGVMSILETQIQAEKVQIAQIEQLTKHLNNEISAFKQKKQLTTKLTIQTLNFIL